MAENPGLPRAEELASLLRLGESTVVPEILERVLLQPALSKFDTAGREYRSQLLEFAFGIADQGRTNPSAAKPLCEKGAFVVEALHGAAALLDAQEFEPAGAPGWNAGNWLYFWPLERLKTWGLSPAQELRVYRCGVQAMLRNQFGQAVDLGGPVDALPQEKIFDACLGSMELGAGARMQLAAQIGALLGNADPATETLLAEFGKAFGVALQMFADIADQKESLRLRRPSWVWAVAAQYSHPEDFAKFLSAVRLLPQAQATEQWLEDQALEVRAKSLAIEYLNRAFDPLEDRLGEKQSLVWVRDLAEKLKRAAFKA